MNALQEMKKLTVTEALDLVRDGDAIVVPTAAGEPPTLLQELSRRRREWTGVRVHQVLAAGFHDYFEAETADHVRHCAYFLGPPARPGARMGHVDVIPTHFSMIPQMLRRGVLPCDVVFAICSPPDEDGYVHLGLSVDYTLAAMEKARTVVVECHPMVPRSNGDCRVHLSRVSGYIESTGEVFQVGLPEVGPVQEAIGGYVADQIPDGATLQIGYGGITDAVVSQLVGKADLGIHTEVIGDAILGLIEEGVVTNRRKTVHRGQTVATFALGTERLYRYLDDNPDVVMLPVDVVNDPYLAGLNDKLHSINGSMQIDLIGQCGSESLGPVPYSGTGGQTDFVRAANRSRGGCSFIVLASTAKNGTISRIAPVLSPGTHVTTPKNDTDIVVTEYGVARLRGRSLKERAKNLIAIAHPDFRPELTEAATRMNLI